MTIYIESFLLQNTLINYCLLRLVELTTKSKTSIFKLILASIFGAVFSVLISNFLDNIILINVFKVACAMVMIKLAFKTKLKGFIFNLILLFIYTYALGGAIINFTGPAKTTNFGVVINSKVSLEIITIMIIALTYIFQLVAKCIKQKLTYSSFICQLTLYLDGRQLKLNAFLDTGNMLKYEGKPVVLIDLNSYIKLTNTNLINYYLTPSKTVKTGTVNGYNNLKLFKLDKLKIKNGKKEKIILNQYIAISNSINADNYSALISPSLI